jgi:HK97 family phage major capsid protein
MNRQYDSTRAVSLIDSVEGIIEGYIAIWGSPDQPDAYDTWFDKTRPPALDEDLLPIALRYEHGMDSVIGTERIGEVTDIWFDDIGIAFRAALDKTSQFFRRIVMELKNGTADGRLCTSSGSQEYLTKFRYDGSFEVWPLAELSLTAYPAEHRMPQVELIRSKRQSAIVGTDEKPQIDESQEHNEPFDNETDVSVSTEHETEGEIHMLQQLLDALAAAGLPEDATFEQIMSALLESGIITQEDLEAAVGMLAAPPEEGDESRNDRTDSELLVGALATVLEARQQVQNETDLAAAQEENRALRAQLALGNARRSAPPPQQPQRGDTTDGGNGDVNITDMKDLRFDHLNSRQMGYGYKLLRAKGVQPTDAYMRNFAGKIIETVERGPKRHDDVSRGHFQALRSSIGGATRANEVFNTASTSSGSEWVPDESWETEVWEAVRQNLIMDMAMNDMMVIEADSRPGSAVMVPLEGSDPTFYKAAENTTVGADLLPGVLVQPSALDAAQVSVTPLKGMAITYVSTEMLEDSIVPVLAQLDKQFNRKFQEQIEYLFLNGDTVTTASTNINLIDGTPASGVTAPSYLITDGALKYALVTGSSTSRDGGALTTQDFLDTRGLLPNNLVTDPGKIMYISDNSVQLKALALTDWKDISVSTMPTQESGTITKAWGSPYLASGQMALANTAGKISATAGNNTLGRLLCIVPEYWAMVWKRHIKFTTDEDHKRDVTEIVASFRIAFQERSAGAATCSYNITV